MTTLGYTVDDTTWEDLVDVLSLVLGTEYTVQNSGPTTVLITEKSSIPIATTPIHTIGPNGIMNIIPESGLGIWIKGDVSSVTVSLTEST